MQIVLYINNLHPPVNHFNLKMYTNNINAFEQNRDNAK